MKTGHKPRTSEGSASTTTTIEILRYSLVIEEHLEKTSSRHSNFLKYYNWTIWFLIQFHTLQSFREGFAFFWKLLHDFSCFNSLNTNFWKVDHISSVRPMVKFCSGPRKTNHKRILLKNQMNFNCWKFIQFLKIVIMKRNTYRQIF